MDKWDPCTPGFVGAVFRTMLALWVGISLGGLLLFRTGFSGMVTGGLLGIALYLVAMLVARWISPKANYTWILVLLLLQQIILWGGMLILLVGFKVNPIGFVLGVSILPAAIIVTLLWFHLCRKWLSHD
ncbi:MAG: hypothetical protein ACYC7E_06225 [Armatimonadota bacterium]